MKLKISIYSSLFLVIVVFILLITNLKAPNNFPTDSIYTINKGVGLNSLSDDLFRKNIVKSPLMFKVFSVIFGGTKGIIAGDYFLKEGQNTISIANRISNGEYNLKPVKITIPEGFNIFEISKHFSINFKNIDKNVFEKSAALYEGYLFPDTYFFLPNASAEDIIKTMKENFDIRIKTIENEINNFNKPLEDIIKMASIIEKEARTAETRRIIAGILWKRLEIGMPLQIDASFSYINGKTTVNLTLDDLKIDSPYNSYLYKGLPPTPISNPGLDSIVATITPIKTNYLYFLTDNDGNMHYSITHDEHLLNKQKYLK